MKTVLTIIEMKKIKHIALLIVASLLLMACTKAREDSFMLDSNFDGIPQENELIFDVYVSLNLMDVVGLNDTLWLKARMMSPLFVDKISQQAIQIPLNQALFTCQFQITDLLSTQPPSYSLVVKKGALKTKKNDLIAVNFGYPDEIPELLVGLHFKDIGRYAINFINYPNPQIESQVSNVCGTDCDYFWYDLFFGLNNNKSAFVYHAFLDYHFKLDRTDAFTGNNKDYLSNSIYDDAVYTFTVK